MADRKKHGYRSRREFCQALVSMMHKFINPLDRDGQRDPPLWKDESYNYFPVLRRVASEKWNFEDGQGSSSKSGEERIRELIEQVLEIPLNGSDRWMYVKHNIIGAESREATTIPDGGSCDQNFVRQFCKYYHFGPRARSGDSALVFNGEQLYRLVEKVYKKMLESSAGDHFLSPRSTLFCRPMPPNKIFLMISKVRPSLGSPETIQSLYFHTLTDPLEPKVNKASEMADNDSPTADRLSWFLQLLCPMCLKFGCSSHDYGIYSQLLNRTPSCCQSTPIDIQGILYGHAGKDKRRYASTAMPNHGREIIMNRTSRDITRSLHSSTAKFDAFNCVGCFSRRSYNDGLHEIDGVSADIFPSEHTLPTKLLIGTKPVLWKKVLNVVHRCVGTDGNMPEQAPYKPCFCKGDCARNECPCAARGFCEKYCCCTATCIIRFPGCRCHTSCDTKSCPCYAAHRECDADLCLSCFSCEEDRFDCLPYEESGEKQGCSKYAPGKAITNGTACLNDEHSLFLRFKQLAKSNLENPVRFRCKNLALQLRDAKELYVADSDVHGIGVFAAEDLEPGDFICEYTGEIISQAEADRRGLIYDYTGKSYLFTLNRDLDIDATRFGNEARFINHSSRPNCVPDVKLVYGSHRIGIYATTSIKRNSELFFNYRYSKKDSKCYPDLT